MIKNSTTSILFNLNFNIYWFIIKFRSCIC